MSAYIIVDVNITDPMRYEEYKKLTPASLEQFEGRFIVRGGKADILEGTWTPGRVVVLEFPSVEQARAWWSSDIYAGPKAIRHRAADTQMILVEGV